MNFIRKVFDTSYELVQREPNRPSVFVYCKLVEETCELSDVFYNVAASEPLSGEVADVIISALDLLYLTDFKHLQQTGSMDKNEIFDSMMCALNLANPAHNPGLRNIESRWFNPGIDGAERNLVMINHYKGRLTRVLNQPHRTEDTAIDMINKIIFYTARLACDFGRYNWYLVEVEKAFDLKIAKWRVKAGIGK